VVEELKSFNHNTTQYNEWLKANEDKIITLPALAWRVECLEQQKIITEVSNTFL